MDAPAPNATVPSNVFGRVFIDSARNPSRDRARSLPDALRSEVEDVVDASLYAVIQVLDGVTAPIGNERFDLQFVLSARLRDKASGEIVDDFELSPRGEGLCMGFHG